MNEQDWIHGIKDLEIRNCKYLVINDKVRRWQGGPLLSGPVEVKGLCGIGDAV